MNEKRLRPWGTLLPPHAAISAPRIRCRRCMDDAPCSIRDTTRTDFDLLRVQAGGLNGSRETLVRSAALARRSELHGRVDVVLVPILAHDLLRWLIELVVRGGDALLRCREPRDEPGRRDAPLRV